MVECSHLITFIHASTKSCIQHYLYVFFSPFMAQTRHRVTHDTYEIDHKLLDAFWEVVTPYALKLRDFIMQNTTLFRYPPGSKPASPPASVPVKIPSLTTRRAACTHLTMTRLYGNHRCNVCNQTSEFGWVYSCTQDEAPSESVDSRRVDELPRQQPFEESYTIPPNINQDQNHSFLMPTHELSPSVEKAIKDGCYTSEQVQILRNQKQNLVNAVKAALENFEESERLANVQTPPDTAPESMDANPDLTFPQARDAAGAGSAHEEKLPDAPKLEMFPHCEFRACQCCRPTYRDRTWLHFEDIFAMELPLPAEAFKDNNRPIAKVSLMKRIGLRSRRRMPQRRHLHSRSRFSYDGDGRILRPQLYRTPENPINSSDIADESVEPESKGFRDSMKRAFRGMMASRHDQPHQLGRKRKAKESSTSDEDAAEFDMGLWNRLNDDLLREASSVPLPSPTKDSFDGPSTTGQKTDIAGVAVTEEAAEMKSADIILSV